VHGPGPTWPRSCTPTLAVRILLTNDDGVFSPGVLALAEAASRFGEVRIVAPDMEQSSVAHAITASRPLSQRPARVGRFEAFRVNGTPADCVGLGLFVWGPVDLVLSGINLGLNVGNAMWHSGTLAAAKQASLLGVRGIALSAPDVGEELGYVGLRPYVETVIHRLLDLPQLGLVNVNFPSRPRGLRWSRQSVRHYDGRMLAVRKNQLHHFPLSSMTGLSARTSPASFNTPHPARFDRRSLQDTDSPRRRL